MERSIGGEVLEQSLPIGEVQGRRIVLPRTAVQAVLEGGDPAAFVRGSEGRRDRTLEPTILTADSRESRRRDRRSPNLSDGGDPERFPAVFALVVNPEVDAGVSRVGVHVRDD